MAQRSPGTFFFKFDQGAAGTTELVAAVTGKKIVLKALVFTMSAAGTATLKSATTAISGAMPIAANGGMVMPPVKDEAYAECAVSEALNITTTVGLAKGFGAYSLES